MPFINLAGCKCKSYNEHFRQFPRLHSKMGRVDVKITGDALVSQKCLDLVMPESHAQMLLKLYTQIGPYELSMMYQYIVRKDNPLKPLNQVELDKLIYRQDRIAINKLYFGNRVMHAFALDSTGARIPGRYLVAIPTGSYSFTWINADAVGRKVHDEKCVECNRTTTEPISLRCLVPAISNWDSLAPIVPQVDRTSTHQYAQCAPLVVGDERRRLKPTDLAFKTCTVGRAAISTGESIILSTWTGTGAPSSPGTISISSDSSMLVEGQSVEPSTSDAGLAASTVSLSVATVGGMPSTSEDNLPSVVTVISERAKSSDSPSLLPSTVSTCAKDGSANVFASPAARPKTVVPSKVLATSYIDVASPVISALSQVSSVPTVSAPAAASVASISPMSISVDNSSKVASIAIKSPAVGASMMQVDTSVGSVVPMSISADTNVEKVKSPGAPSCDTFEICTIWSEESIGFGLPELTELVTMDVVGSMVETVADEETVVYSVSGDAVTAPKTATESIASPQVTAEEGSSEEGSAQESSGGQTQVSAAGDVGDTGARSVRFDDALVTVSIPARVVNTRPSEASIQSGPSSLCGALAPPIRPMSIDTQELIDMWDDSQSSPSGSLNCALAQYSDEVDIFQTSTMFEPVANPLRPLTPDE